jgi:hypothetical protein
LVTYFLFHIENNEKLYLKSSFKRNKKILIINEKNNNFINKQMYMANARYEWIKNKYE